MSFFGVEEGLIRATTRVGLEERAIRGRVFPCDATRVGLRFHMVRGLSRLVSRA